MFFKELIRVDDFCWRFLKEIFFLIIENFEIPILE